MLNHVAVLIFVFTITNYFIPAAQQDDLFQCNSGTLYVLNRCSMCQCVDQMLMACTLFHCDGEDYFAAKNCKLGSKWKELCNDCQCVAAYGTVCTARECPAPKPADPNGGYDYPLGPDPESIPDFHAPPISDSSREYYDN